MMARRTKKIALGDVRLTVPVGKGDMVCPCHGTPLVLHHRWNAEEGRYGGSCYVCGEYGECGYYVSGDLKTRPVVDGNGIALGKALGLR